MEQVCCCYEQWSGRKAEQSVLDPGVAYIFPNHRHTKLSWAHPSLLPFTHSTSPTTELKQTTLFAVVCNYGQHAKFQRDKRAVRPCDPLSEVAFTTASDFILLTPSPSNPRRAHVWKRPVVFTSVTFSSLNLKHMARGLSCPHHVRAAGEAQKCLHGL